MSRKSCRTTTAAYRRQQVTWDNASPSIETDIGHDSSRDISKANVPKDKTIGRLVTPSPKSLSTPTGFAKDESQPKKSPGTRQLFSGKWSSFLSGSKPTPSKEDEVFCQPSSSLAHERIDISPQKQLFQSFQTDEISTPKGAGNANLNIIERPDCKQRIRKKKLSPAAKKSIVSARNSRRYKRTEFSTGDSLASLSSLVVKHPKRNLTTSSIKNERKVRIKRLNFGPERSKRSAKEASTNINTSHTRSPTKTERSRNEAAQIIAEEGEEMNTAKDIKSVPTKFVPLLASLATPSNKLVKARSTLEILDDFNRRKKELKSERKRITRARFPRACKNSQRPDLKGFLTDEEIEKELQLEDDDDDDDDDSKDEDWKEVNVGKPHSSTDLTFSLVDIYPLTSKLKPRPKKLHLSPSTVSGTGDVLLPVADDDSNKKSAITMPEPKPKPKQGHCSLNRPRHEKPAVRSLKVDQSKNSCTFPAKDSSTEKNIPNTAISKEISFEVDSENLKRDDEKQGLRKGALRRTRKRGRPRENTSETGTTKTEMSSNNVRTTNELAVGSHMFKQSRISPCHRAQHPNQFSIEEYSMHSCHSKNQLQDRTGFGDVANSSRPALGLENINKDSRKSNLQRRGIQEYKSQKEYAYPTENASAHKKEGQSPISTNHTKANSPRKEPKAHQSSPRQHEKASVSSKKRVRFDSSTTTFSVKIKIRRNIDTSGKNRKRSNHGQSVALSPSLDESAVQAIANQVTQACLTQATTSPSACQGTDTGAGAGAGAGGDTGIDVNVDMNNGDQSSSHSSQDSSSSIQSSQTGERSEEQNKKNGYPMIVTKINPPVVETGLENCYEARRNYDDARSVTSELTSDWSRPSQFNYQQQAFKDVNDNVVSSSSRLPAHKQFDNCDGNLLCESDSNRIETSRREDKVYHHRRQEMRNIKIPPRDISSNVKNEDRRSCSSTSRRQRVWGCADSLAGSLIDAKTSVTIGSSSMKIPREVSLQKRSTRSWEQSNTRKHVLNNDAGIYLNTKQGSEDEKEKAIKHTPVFPDTPKASTRSRLVPFSPTHRCGKCQGCRRTLDCQTCDACLEKLYCYGAELLSGQDRMCLLRRCQRTCRVGSVDSLLGVTPMSKSIHSNPPAKKGEGHSAGQHQDKSISNHGTEKISPLKLSEETNAKNTKAPWDDGDDWTVDYSYLSEPEYRRRLSEGVNYSEREKASSTRSLSTPSWWSSSNAKQPIRTSLSSISESVMSREKSTWLQGSVCGSTKKQRRGRGKRVKRKRDPLHGVALPGASTDACSVASWRENRKCLRALMEYDEGDQDWV